MIELSTRRIAEIVGGRIAGDLEGDGAPAHPGLSIDTRTLRPGEIFVAIRGAQFDGNAFAAEAAARGAGLLVLDGPGPGRLPAAHRPPIVRCADGRAALAALARAWRASLRDLRVVAVTGSCGKTTTKRLVHGALAEAMPVASAERSFNNEVGVPLTVLAVERGHRALVAEVGTNAPGEIAHLGAIVRPHVAIVTMVGTAHLGGFGSREAIRREKASLLTTLEPGGTAIVPDDEPRIEASAPLETVFVRFGASEHADVRLVARRSDETGQDIALADGARFRLELRGEHNARNALAAIAAARALGLDDATIARGLAAVHPEAMRLERATVADIDLWNDAYNANPDSMRAALAAFVEGTPAATRRVVVLGTMGELGAESERLHRDLAVEVAGLAARGAVTQAFFVGEHAPAMAEAAGGTARAVADDAALPALLDAEIQPGDALLLKASRAVRLERAAAHLATRGATHRTTHRAARPAPTSAS